jgi:hypothetical protein
MTLNRPFVLQAITTKFIGPTNTKGSRIKATCQAASLTVNSDYALSIEQNHAAAAKALADKMGWRGDWYQGGIPGSGFAFVCSNGTRGNSLAFTTTGAEG